jgi:Protein of unknown function (DUF3303)
MLFMIVEHFKDGKPGAIGERFGRNGRMLPGEVIYHASWVDLTGPRCFQVMETARREFIDKWTHSWEDLVDFEIIPVLTSADFWAKNRLDSTHP